MYQITLIDLSIGFVPVLFTLAIIFYWADNFKSAVLAVVRMLVQLMAIGYALNFIFNADNQWIILFVLLFMLLAASWISLNTLPLKSAVIFKYSLLSIFGGGVSILIWVTQGVLHIDPWYQPAVIIPLAGMIFSNSMNSISLAGERLFSELQHGVDYHRARSVSFQAAMIPVINSLFAVGLVSLPGMMTGQILAGVSPLIAARYQIVVMCMIFASAGISTVIFLWLLKKQQTLVEQHA